MRLVSLLVAEQMALSPTLVYALVEQLELTARQRWLVHVRCCRASMAVRVTTTTHTTSASVHLATLERTVNSYHVHVVVSHASTVVHVSVMEDCCCVCVERVILETIVRYLLILVQACRARMVANASVGRAVISTDVSVERDIQDETVK